ncbi:YqjF family protein [Saliphagus sp. GCM10025334]
MTEQRILHPESTTAETEPASLPWLPHPFSMVWRDGAFLHWPVDPDRLRPHVPDRFDLETVEDRAWLSIVPFVLAQAGVRDTPSAMRVTRPELNLRTYVRYRDVSGLYFFSIDIDGPWLAFLARWGLDVPCFDARQRVDGTDGRVTFSSERDDPSGGPARFDAEYRPVAPPTRARPDSLTHWLTERRRMLVPYGDRTLVAEIAHEPWSLAPAEVTIHENDLFEAADVPTPAGDPLAHYCERLEITGSIPRFL